MPENREEQGKRAGIEGGSVELAREEREIYRRLDRLDARLEGLSGANAGERDGAEKVLVIDLQALLYRLIERWIFILTAALACAAVAAVAVFFLITPKYEATARLYVLSPNDSAVNLSDLQIGAYLTSDYQEVFTTWEVHQRVIDNLGLDYSYEELEDMLKIENPSDTRILRITFRSADPQEARDAANEYADVARQYIGVTMKTEEPMVMSRALMPLKPESPRKALDILLGFLLGGLAAAGIATLQFIQDDKVKTAEEIQKYGGMATLAVVPSQESDKGGGERG